MKNKKITIRILSALMAGSLFGGFAASGLDKNADGNYIAALAGGASAYSTEASVKRIEGVLTDAEKYFDKDLVYKLPDEISESDEISVIVSMSTETVLDEYENYGGSLEFGEFVTTERAKKAERDIEQQRNQLISSLKKGGVKFEVGEKYDTLLGGFEMTIKAGDFAAAGEILGEKATLIIGDEYEKAESKVVNNEVSVYTTGIFDSSSSAYNGDGVVVAILDTGLDYTHSAFDVSHFNIQTPAFTQESVSEKVASTVAATFSTGLSGADVYMNEKIPYAYDYADKDSDVLPINSEHGTHVAGIIAGRDDEITGVAPEAQLAIMKVFSDNRTGAKTSWILSALEDCVVLGVDVINMSLGSQSGFTREVDKENINKVYDKIKARGISLLASAGNEANATRGSKKNGTNGLVSNPDSGTVGAPSTYDAALSVASVDGVKTPYITFNGRIIYFNEATNSSAKKKDFITEILRPYGVDSREFEFVTIPGIGRETDYPYDDPEYYKDKIVLVKRGQTTFEEKIRIALVDKGAAGVIIYNNISGSISMSVGNDVGAACSVSQDDGEFLAAAKTGRILISQEMKAGPFMSDFSSWGPTNDLKIKPEITGHGGEIYSSVPGNAYDRMSGTSMSAPNVAGATALIRQYVKFTTDVFGENLSALDITAIVNRLMMSTADIVYNKNGLPYAVRKQGAGLVNINKSCTAEAYLITYDKSGNAMDRTKIEYGDDKQKSGVYTMRFSIKNVTDKQITYDVGAIMITEGVSETFTGHGEKTVTQDGYLLGTSATVLSVDGGTNSGNVVTVGARGTATVELSVVLSDEDKAYLDASFENGMYVEGFVTAKAGSNATVDLNIPFLAFYGDWTKAPVFDEEYYDTNTDELNDGLDDDDKLMADGYATRVYGGLYSDYIATLGTYYFEQDPRSSKIAASKEHIALSNQTSINNLSVNAIKSISAGLLRNAKRVDIVITEDATGEEVFRHTENNVRKSVSYGSDMYGSTIDVDYSVLEHDLKNNTRYTVTVTAYIDYGADDEQSNVRNVFEFPLYIDFEAPIITDVSYRVETDSTTKKKSYFADITVYDNHYSMGLSLGQIIPTTDPEAKYTFEMNSFGKYVTPIYSSYNGKCLVTVELTDYVADIRNSAGVKYFADGSYVLEYNNDSFIAVLYDYALNNAVYQLRLPDDFISVEFTEEEVRLSPNETLKLDEIMNIYPADNWINTLDFTSADKTVAEVSNQVLLAKASGDTSITVEGYDETGRKVAMATLNVHVLSEDEEGYNGWYTVPEVSKFEISGYKVTKAFYDVSSSEREIGVEDGVYSFGSSPSLSMFPSESVTVKCTLDSYFDKEQTRIVYSSSDDSIVHVDAYGRVTALAKGEATVFAEVEYRESAESDWQGTYYSGTIAVTVKDPFDILSIYLNSYKGLGGEVVIPDDRGITIINSYAFSGYKYVDKELDKGDVIDDEDPYYIKQAAYGENTITKVVIPEGVTTIEISAFENLTKLQEVVLPTTLTRIGKDAFKGCTALTTINLDNVKFINASAFEGCTSLGGVLDEENFGNIVAIGNYSFKDCKFTKITFPESSQSLGKGAFYGNESLTQATFEAAKIKIAESVFEGCKELRKIDINAAVISAYAFSGCAKLQTVTLGKDVSIIGECAFAGTNVSSFNLDAANAYFTLGAGGKTLLSKDGKRLVLVAPTTQGAFTTTAEEIGTGAFAGCKVTSVRADNAVVVGAYAFKDCSSLSSVYIDSVEIIGAYAFNGTNIDEVTFLAKVREIGEHAFEGLRLSSVTIEAGCKVGEYAFKNCDISNEVIIGDGAVIGDYAFYGEISLLVYSGDEDATNVVDDTKVDNSVQYRYSLTNKQVEFIEEYYEDEDHDNIYKYKQEKFSGGVKSNLPKLTAGTGVIFGAHAFDGNAKMISLTLGEGCKIGDYAFYNAAALAAVDLSGVEEVGDYAFSGVYIKALTFHKGTTDAWCGDAYEEEYDDQGNLVSRRPIYTYFAPKIASVNLSSATKVGKGAFAYNGSLTNATINAGLTEISDNAFASCSKLDDIDLSGATSVGAYAFYGTAIETVNLGGAKTVGKYAFAESKVETVTLGEGAYLAEGAFAYCFKLSAVVGLSTATYIGGYAFSGSALTEANLSGAEYLGDFAFANSLIEEVEFGDNLSYIGENPFAYCASLASFGKKYTVKAGNKDIEYFTESYDISDSVFVEDGALYRKSAAGFVLASFPEAHEATSVTVKEGTTRISAKAFVGSGIKSVVLPSTLKSLGDKAFYGCNNLGTVVFKSYDAPVLEEAYDASYMGYDNIPISGYTYNYYEDKVYQGLGISKYFMWNYLNSGNNFYYGANFDNYVGKVDRAIVMVSPVNGNNYDSFIFSKYFSASVSGAPAATTETLYAVGLIDLLPENISLSDEAEIVKARAAYDDIPTLEQKSLVTNYGKLTSAENTLQYLKSRSESTPDDSESISEQTETKDNGGIIAIAIISGIVNLVFAAGILLMSISILKGKKSEVEAGGEKTDDEKGGDEKTDDENTDDGKYVYDEKTDDGASDKKE